MARRFPDEVKDVVLPDKLPKPPGITTQEYTIKIVTPMFGGGVKGGENDTDMLIRPTTIRGHLRFWWRVMNGAKYTSVAEMREAENGKLSKDKKIILNEGIWGSTEIPSSVGIQVLSQPKSLDKREPDKDFGFARFGAEAYALFPAKSNDNSLLKEGGEFTIQISYPAKWDEDGKFTKEVESAIWAWVNFGGIGARTRRGCGALFCEDIKGTFAIPEKLHGVFIGNNSEENAMSAWQKAVNIYKRFRQDDFRGAKHKKRVGRDGKEVLVPGRSKWSEPDSIRYLTGCSLKPRPEDRDRIEKVVDPAIDTHDHSAPLVAPELMPCFPRAVLGLPIEIHFADGPGDKGSPPPQKNKDPKKTRIFPKKANNEGVYDRMSSPIITRPIFRNNKWYPAVIVLHSSREVLSMLSEGVEISGDNVIPENRNSDLKRGIPLTNIAGEKFKQSVPMKGSDNALDAFIAFIKTNGFKISEVSQ